MNLGGHNSTHNDYPAVGSLPEGRHIELPGKTKGGEIISIEQPQVLKHKDKSRLQGSG